MRPATSARIAVPFKRIAARGNALLRIAAFVLLACSPAHAAHAETRAWLDRDRIAMGETTTLNIETDQLSVTAPDYTPLQSDFVVSGNSSSRQIEIVNGQTRVRMLFAVALQPKRDGLITIPPLRLGAQSTSPLTLSVTPEAAAPSARAGDPAFIETETDIESPYVQQAMGYVVRLYYATPLISGQLEQEPPDGATLQRIGDDVQYTRRIGGRDYKVVERRFLLIPERSGTLTIPGARFQGRGVGGFFDDLFGDGERALRANSAPRFLRVRPAPANAPQPWLPLRGLALRYLAAPQRARAGEAASVVIEAVADGANATQMPDIELPPIDGAQVFAEPAQTDETFVDGRPRVKVTRKFSIVPAQAGTLRVPGPRIAWWDVRAGGARTASLPDLNLNVAPGAPGTGAAAQPARSISAADDGESWIRVPGVQGEVRPWAAAAVAFALLWLGTLMWALQYRAAIHASRKRGTTESSHASDAGAARPDLRALKQALDTGDLGDVAHVLCAMATPPAHDLDALRARLDDSAQQRAIDELQRARWAGGDGAAARAALRDAFKAGPRWRRTAGEGKALLPPLYPE